MEAWALTEEWFMWLMVWVSIPTLELSSRNKSDIHDIAEKLMKLTINAYGQLHVYCILNIADVTEWPQALDIRQRDWWCSALVVRVWIPWRVEQKVIRSPTKNLILTPLGLIFRCIYILYILKMIFANHITHVFPLFFCSDYAPRTVVLQKGAEGYGFILRGAKCKLLE